MSNLKRKLKRKGRDHLKEKGSRRTLKFIDQYPTPEDLTERTVLSKGWEYKTNREDYKTRDMALIAIAYICALRISEVLRLTRSQFKITARKIEVRSILLSKTKRKGRARLNQFRPYAFIPLFGPRENLGFIVKKYLDLMDSRGDGPESLLFKFGRKRAFQIVSATLEIPIHWLRAYGEDYLYDLFKKDILAVADYVSIDSGTLAKYIRRSYRKYPEG